MLKKNQRKVRLSLRNLPKVSLGIRVQPVGLGSESHQFSAGEVRQPVVADLQAG